MKTEIYREVANLNAKHFSCKEQEINTKTIQ